MIDPGSPRAELLETLAELSRRYPDWRLGQLVANVAEWENQTVWDVEDSDLLRIARRHREPAAAPIASRVHS